MYDFVFNRIIIVLFIVYIFIFPLQNCYASLSTKGSGPIRTVISGNVLNPKSKDTELIIFQPGLSQTVYTSDLDSLNNFSFSFDIYIPTDILLGKCPRFYVLVHPGDSIHVIFDGSQSARPDIMKSIQFTGDASKINQDAAIFQSMYAKKFPCTEGPDYNLNRKICDQYVNYDLDHFEDYLDTIRSKGKELINDFITQFHIDKEVKTWAEFKVEEDYYDLLGLYPFNYRLINNLSNQEWDVPLDYYDAFLERLPITVDQLQCGYDLTAFTNRYHYGYIFNHVWAELDTQKYINSKGIFSPPAGMFDSLELFGIIKFTPDTLLRQFVLAEYFHEQFDQGKIDVFEKFNNDFAKYVLEPYLREGLLKKYRSLKNTILNPQFEVGVIFKNVEKSAIKQIIDSILTTNKGKIIYIDCWGTWCGPCRLEMVNSKKLFENLKGNDVSFVYLCLDSKENEWKSYLSVTQLKGQHFLLTRQQSSDLRKVFEIKGVPYYLIFDKNGKLIEKGNHLIPENAKIKIEELLK